METSLHRSLKSRYAASEADTEVRLGAYRIDAICNDELIEVQFASLAAIRDKITALVKKNKVRVVKPIVAQRRIIRQSEPDGPVVSRRLSPKKGCTLDIFDELVFLTRIFPHPNLTIEAPLVSVEEWRLPPGKRRSRRQRFRSKHKVKDVILSDVLSTRTFRTAADLKRLAEVSKLPQPFDTADLAKHHQRPRWVAQRITYVLRKIGAIEEVGKRGNALVYRARKRRQAA